MGGEGRGRQVGSGQGEVLGTLKKEQVGLLGERRGAVWVGCGWERRGFHTRTAEQHQEKIGRCHCRTSLWLALVKSHSNVFVVFSALLEFAIFFQAAEVRYLTLTAIARASEPGG